MFAVVFRGTKISTSHPRDTGGENMFFCCFFNGTAFPLIPHSLHPSFSLETTHFSLLAHSLKRMMPEENGEGTARNLNGTAFPFYPLWPWATRALFFLVVVFQGKPPPKKRNEDLEGMTHRVDHAYKNWWLSDRGKKQRKPLSQLSPTIGWQSSRTNTRGHDPFSV